MLATRTGSRIVDAVRTLVLERGFADLTMDDIADAAGCSRSTAYRHGRDPVDLLLEVAAGDLEEMPVPQIIYRQDVTCFARAWTARHARSAEIDAVLRAVARTGVPRARGLVAREDLRRHTVVRMLTAQLGMAVDDRRHLLFDHLGSASYLELVVRFGWSDERYARRLAGGIDRLSRFRLIEDLP